MYATTEKHTEIILHDCTVCSLTEEETSIVVKLDDAVLSPQHPANHFASFQRVFPVELRLNSIVSSEVKFWNDSKKCFEIRPERLPVGLAEIIEPEKSIVEADNVCLWIINGFDALTGQWLEWRVRFKEFRMSWSKEEKMK